jgi:hypothetical protein
MTPLSEWKLMEVSILFSSPGEHRGIRCCSPHRESDYRITRFVRFSGIATCKLAQKSLFPFRLRVYNPHG